MCFAKLWEIVELFKKDQIKKGWTLSRYGDVVKRGGELHDFLWIRVIHPSTFKSIAKHHQCAIQEDNSTRMVKAKYTAWICEKSPFSFIKQILERDPELLERNAIYDLSHASRGFCEKINKTTSQVFQEFETFLQKQLGLKIKTF